MADADRGRGAGAVKRSMLAILSVLLVESFVGSAVGSLAIMSDALHALYDFASTLIIFISIRASSRPPDEDHMYGHEKFEYLGGMLGGVALLALAAAVASEAVSRAVAGSLGVRVDLGPVGYAALAYTLSVDLARAYVLRPGAGGSPAVRAAFYHALSDLGSTLIALLGFSLSLYGAPYGDSLASLALSALLALLSARLVWSCAVELSDVAPREAVERVREQIERASRGLLEYGDLKVRRVGGKFFVRATLRFPDYVGLEEAHEVATEVERGISKALGEADVSLHIEPSLAGGVPTRELLRRVASGVEGVVDAHEVDVARRGGRTYVSLHIRVDPSKPLSEAHEVAERVEGAIRASMGEVDGVFVHVEPSSIEPSRGGAVSDREVGEIVQSVIEEHGGRVRARRVVTYLAEGRRRVNVECSLSEDVTIEEAHRVALEIEGRIKERLSETTVTVHMEPGGG